jgi:metal-dependent amidase/aminoacylase/carboxypeptidase family protein
MAHHPISYLGKIQEVRKELHQYPEYSGREKKTAARKLELPLGEREVPFRWSEDFGEFTAKFPGAIFGLGFGENHPDLHTLNYDFPDEIIESGIRMFYEIVN